MSGTPCCRPLVDADLDTVLFWYADDGPDAHWLRRFAADPSARVWVMGDAQPLGVIWFRVTLDEAELIDIRVALDARGKGIGRILLNAGLAALDDENIIECHLEVRESNAIARHLYLQMGFQETGRRRNYYPSPAVPNGREDAMLMSRRRQKGIAPS